MLKNKSILKLVAVLTVMVMSMAMLAGCGAKKEEKKVSSFEDPIKNYIEGVAEANSEKFLKAFPTFISDTLKSIFSDDYLKEIKKENEEKFGEDVTISYKVKEKTEISQDDINSIKESVKTTYDKELNITKGYKVDLDITTKGSKDEETDSETIDVYEVDGVWCILNL